MKRLLITATLLLFALNLQAQQRQRPDREQIRAAKVAFITNRLDLTSEQAQEFWPIFNEYEKKKSELGRDYGKQKRALVPNRNYDNLSEEAATKLTAIYLEQKEAEAKIEKEYLSKFQAVLTAQQTWKLIRSEGDFRRSLMQRISRSYQERKQGDRKNGN